MKDIEQYIEALIFVSEQSIRAEEIQYCLQAAFEQDFTGEEIEVHLQNIAQKYQDERFAIELAKISNGYQSLACYRHNGRKRNLARLRWKHWLLLPTNSR